MFLSTPSGAAPVSGPLRFAASGQSSGNKDNWHFIYGNRIRIDCGDDANGVDGDDEDEDNDRRGNTLAVIKVVMRSRRLPLIALRLYLNVRSRCSFYLITPCFRCYGGRKKLLGSNPPLTGLFCTYKITGNGGMIIKRLVWGL